jgi:hypothetical protein
MDMTDVIEFLKFHMYADNLHSWPRNMLSECIREVKIDQSRIFESSWFSSGTFFGEDFISYVYKAKKLGVTFRYFDELR